MSLGVDFTRTSFRTEGKLAPFKKLPGADWSLVTMQTSARCWGDCPKVLSWVIFEVTGLSTPMWCRWAHPHSRPSRSSFIRPSEWPHSSPSPQLVTLHLSRGPRTNFSLIPLADLPRTTHLSHASLLFRSMWWQASSLASNYLRWSEGGI